VFRTRAKPALASLQGADRCAFLPGKPAPDDLLTAWRRLDDKPLVELTSAPEHLSFNVARSCDGKRTLVYLINYGPQAVAGCEVKLNPPKSPRSLRLHTPGAAARSLARQPLVKIPAFDLFAVLEAK
jgi:hypothetical protein